MSEFSYSRWLRILNIKLSSVSSSVKLIEFKVVVFFQNVCRNSSISFLDDYNYSLIVLSFRIEFHWNLMSNDVQFSMLLNFSNIEIFSKSLKFTISLVEFSYPSCVCTSDIKFCRVLNLSKFFKVRLFLITETTIIILESYSVFAYNLFWIILMSN